MIPFTYGTVVTKDFCVGGREALILGIDNLDGFRKFQESHNVHLVGETREFADQGMRMFKFKDPDGNTLTVSEVEL
ncbi:MAG: hypothetical protein U9N32_09020 [Spirochaetota bacterium]|nr:hypothetical protein [Spirochaetota bacterium]